LFFLLSHWPFIGTYAGRSLILIAGEKITSIGIHEIVEGLALRAASGQYGNSGIHAETVPEMQPKSTENVAGCDARKPAGLVSQYQEQEWQRNG
jgi:hypothetical protein